MPRRSSTRLRRRAPRPAGAHRGADVAGLRIGEATALRWRDIDLARSKITVSRSKTDAGVRVVDILPVLQDELTAHRATVQHAGPDDLVFPTSSGSRRDKGNARERVVHPVVKRADELLAERGQERCPPA